MLDFIVMQMSRGECEKSIIKNTKLLKVKYNWWKNLTKKNHFTKSVNYSLIYWSNKKCVMLFAFFVQLALSDEYVNEHCKILKSKGPLKTPVEQDEVFFYVIDSRHS